MSKIAIDVVLLPDTPMAQQAIEISKLQSEQFSDKIVLNEKNCLPHISLAMGVLEITKLSGAEKILTTIASTFAKFELVADSYRGSEITSGDIVSEFTIKKIPELQSLHESIMAKLEPFLSYDVSIDMVYSPPAVEEITLHWIKNYKNRSSFEKFEPHITLGFGELKEVKVPIDFTASTLALCHLGNYCTCRKILFSKKFG